MRMLLLRPARRPVSGAAKRVPVVRDRVRKYGRVTREQCLSIRRDVLITGPNQSGKSRWLAKLEGGGDDIWI